MFFTDKQILAREVMVAHFSGVQQVALPGFGETVAHIRLVLERGTSVAEDAEQQGPLGARRT